MPVCGITEILNQILFKMKLKKLLRRILRDMVTEHERKPNGEIKRNKLFGDVIYIEGKVIL